VLFVIDTSSALSALALVDPSGAVIREELHESGRSFDLPARYRTLADGAQLTKVAVATGPGSFTGLRVGVSFGLGLAIGLRIPIVPLATLKIQAARSDVPVLAVAEAGRGRVYFARLGAAAGVGEPAELPKDLALAGWLRPSTQAALEAAGLRFKPESELRSFGAAAARELESAREAAYGSLKLEYMQSFSAHR
jgi:tRNA threonylcarbamoyladenosine biosynthesis protein TsaB